MRVNGVSRLAIQNRNDNSIHLQDSLVVYQGDVVSLLLTSNADVIEFAFYPSE